MLPLMNQPLVQNHIEYFVQAGFEQFLVVAVDYPIPLGEFLGDGSRWGVAVELVVLKEPYPQDRLLERISSKLQGLPAIIVPVEIVLDIDVKGLVDFQKAGNDQCVKVYRRNQLEMVGAFQSSTPSFRKKLLSHPAYTGIMVTNGDPVPEGRTAGYLCEGNFMKIDTPFALWAANMAGLARSFSSLAKQGLSTPDTDVVVGHHFHRGADTLLVGPMLIGHHVRINTRASLEGWNVVGNGVFIDKGAQIARSVVSKNTYIGAEVTVEDSIVCGKLFYNLEVGQWVQVADSFILSDTRDNEVISFLEAVWHRVAAVFCLVLFVPFIISGVLLRKIRGKESFQIRQVSLTKASFSSAYTMKERTVNLFSFGNWETFIGRLPGLLNVVLGQIRLVGVRPLELPCGRLYEEEWTRLREDAPCGLFTPVDAESLNLGGEEAKIVAENYYAATRSFRTDVKMFFVSAIKLLQLTVTSAVKRILGGE
jgi:NDP-sugar pyrophosphorylase family protein